MQQERSAVERQCAAGERWSRVVRMRLAQLLRVELGVLMLVALGACVDNPMPAPLLARREARVASFAAGECVASVRMITQETDSLDAIYGWIPQSDTIDLCETWNGTDYIWKFVTVGTSEAESGVCDMARDASYDAGMITVTNKGSYVSTQPVGATLFETFNADPGLVQASYDDPYYGIRALGGDIGADPGGGACTTCLYSRAPSQGSASGAALTDTLFRRHRISRRGVRGLVESMDEAGLSSDGLRRFVRSEAAGQHVILVHPQLELIMGEAWLAADGDILSRTSWTRIPGGFVRASTVIEARQHDTRRLIDRTVITFSNVLVNEPPSGGAR